MWTSFTVMYCTAEAKPGCCTAHCIVAHGYTVHPYQAYYQCVLLDSTTSNVWGMIGHILSKKGSQSQINGTMLLQSHCAVGPLVWFRVLGANKIHDGFLYKLSSTLCLIYHGTAHWSGQKRPFDLPIQ